MEKTRNFIFDELCRLCLEQSGVKVIYDINGLQEDILAFIGVQVSSSDQLPTKICLKCYETIQQVKTLRILALRCDSHLRILFANGETNEERESEKESRIVEILNTLDETDPASISSYEIKHEKEEYTLTIRRDLYDETTPTEFCDNTETTVTEIKHSSTEKQKDNKTCSCKKETNVKDEDLEYECGMPPKKRTRHSKVTDSEIMKLFEEVSDDSSAPSVDEYEKSSDELEGSQRRPQGIPNDLMLSEEEHDPYSDINGDFGSDGNYNSAEDEGMLSDSSSSLKHIQPSKERHLIEHSDSDKTVSDFELQNEGNLSPNLLSPQPFEPLCNSDAVVESSPDITSTSNDQDIALPSALVTVSASPQPLELTNEIVTLQPVPTTTGPLIAELDIIPSSNISSNSQNKSPTVSESSWQNDTAPIPQFEFDEVNAGATVHLDENTTPISIFNLFFTDELVEHMVTCINAYGVSLCNSNRPHTRGSRRLSFTPTDSTELKKFLGLCLLQGQIDSPNIRNLFTQTDPLYFHPIFPFIMSCRRFDQLLRCLCISELNSKGMDKVRDFATAVKINFQNVNKPSQNLSLDESLLAFRGRLSFRQYIKSKKARFGIKFYVLTTDDGYILNFKIYEGKQLAPIVSESNVESTTKLEHLVMSLMNPYLDKGHNLYMDNYYNSLSLSKKLLQRKTHTTGTLRKDRKENPKRLFAKNVLKGQHFWQQKGRVYASIWKDKRAVHMITTKHHPRLVVSRNRYGQAKTKPVEVVDYNKHMSGVDKSDQMMTYYSTPKKTIRWYKKVFFHIFDMIVWNAFYLFKKYCDPNSSLLNFRERIIRSFLQVKSTTLNEVKTFIGKIKTKSNRRSPRAGRIAGNNQQQQLEQPQQPQLFGHWPELIPVSETTKRSKVFLKCRVCTKNKTVKQTSYRCKGCHDHPPLCPGCFETWHLNLSIAEDIES